MVKATRQTEAVPAAYPEITGLSDAAGALPAGFLWQRIEGWTAHRWSAREVVWIVEGPGDWRFPLAPVNSVTSVERWGWDGDAQGFLAADPLPLPEGGFYLEDAVYRVTASVGAGPVPAQAQEAFRRLAEHTAALRTDDQPGVSSYSVSMGEISESYRRNPACTARTLENSGAADLLRQYRRA